jgi:hypothetical protein
MSLTLEQIDHGAWGYRFRVTSRNDSQVKLYLPLPEITGLRFKDIATQEEAEWFCRSLVNARSDGFSLRPTESRSFEWRVRPKSARASDEDSTEQLAWDYRRWSVGLKSGTYLVCYRWMVDADYFDPDSHMRLPDLEYEADQAGAVVWLGQALSNALRVEYAEPFASPDPARE